MHERLLEQGRQEQAAAMRARQLKLFVFVPGVIALFVVSTLMAFSDDTTYAIVGNTLASSMALVFWKLRKRIAAGIGL